ncbi:MAG: flagellar brake protein [Rhodocyclales bacterium]|nr:flagellar brake protein [Rhodocyclales bacterium]
MAEPQTDNPQPATEQPQGEGTPEAAPVAAEKRAPPLLEPGDYAQFILRSRSEITFVLRSLLEHVSQITIFFNEGKELLLTTLVALEDERILFDLGASSETNRKALAAEKLFCVASLEKVRIQFVLRGLQQATYQKRSAFSAAYPTDLLRLQRREFFRLTMPITRPLKCQIPINEAESENQFLVEVNVVDISGGGLAIAMPDGLNFDPGQEFANCRMELPEVGTLTARLKVRNQFEITLRSGGRVRRAGCEFIKLPGPMLTLVQRYIIKVERERKARESGMA